MPSLNAEGVPLQSPGSPRACRGGAPWESSVVIHLRRRRYTTVCCNDLAQPAACGQPTPIALSKQADQTAANSCSGLAPVPAPRVTSLSSPCGSQIGRGRRGAGGEGFSPIEQFSNLRSRFYTSPTRKRAIPSLARRASVHGIWKTALVGRRPPMRYHRPIGTESHTSSPLPPGRRSAVAEEGPGVRVALARRIRPQHALRASLQADSQGNQKIPRRPRRLCHA